MAISISDIKALYSGGSTNINPDLSLGGVISGVNGNEVISQLTSPTTNVTGVTVVNAYSNPLGAGTLKYDPNTSTLYWKPYAGVQFSTIPITGDGTYVIGDSGGYLVVDIVVLNLPVVVAEDADIIVTNKMNNVFDSISSTESLDGRIEYRCLYIKNTHAADTAYDVRIWVRQQPIGPDELDIALDPAGTGNGATTGVAIGPLNDEVDSTNLLSALTWSRPSTQATGLLLANLAPGECRAFWEKRRIPANSTQQVANDTSKIGISVLI